MSQSTVLTNLTRAEAIEALMSLPQEMTGGRRAARATLVRLGLAMLRKIHEAFLVKMRGGTDDAGDRWAPLSPVTIAMRRRKRGGTSSKKGRAPGRQRKASADDLTPTQRRTRAVIKGAGSHFDKYGRDAEILHDTGKLLESLRPGSFSAEQVFEIGDGRVIVGTVREGAVENHEGRPPKLPQRRLWPSTSDWPTSWWDDITEEVQNGVVDMVKELTTGG